MQFDPLELNRKLPDDVVVGGSFRVFAYRNYPVFSLPWLKKRSLLFGVIIGIFALPVGLGFGVMTQKIELGILTAAHFFLAFMVMATAGPALATWIRHRRFSISSERRAVVFAVLIGLIASYFSDQWSSGYIKETTQPYLNNQVVNINSKESEKAGGNIKFTKVTATPDTERVARAPWVVATNLIFLVLAYGALGGGLALRSYFSEQRRLSESRHKKELNAMRLQKNESDLRLGVLQAQIEPHFLFNTLASLRSLIKQDPTRAEVTLDALVDHLRATIPKLREQQGGLVSTVGQQLDICSSYLALMQVRMGSRLSYEINSPAEYRDLDFPPLMLISLVENAIKHGLETKAGNGHIVIKVEKPDDKRLRVSVSDDGVGLKAGLGGGLGLANIREQLAARFGDTAKLVIAARPDAGTIASIELPLSDATA
ncbi:MAG: sensor histidine kinase [Arenimonas sp.]